MKLRVFEIEYTDWDGSIELDRFTAEDEEHAIEKFYRSLILFTSDWLLVIHVFYIII